MDSDLQVNSLFAERSRQPPRQSLCICVVLLYRWFETSPFQAGFKGNQTEKKQTHSCGVPLFPGSIAKGSSSKSGCQLHLPTSHANLSRVTSPANFSCQLVESYFTCQLLMPTCRELLHLLTSHANLSRVTSPAYFSCQLFGCYLILLKAQANLSGVTSLS